MAFNLKNPANVMVGTGTLYLNGQDVGLLKGDVTFSYEPEWNEIKGGSPEQLVKQSLAGETAKISAALMELNPDNVANAIQMFTKEQVAGEDVEITNEYIGTVYDGRYVAANNPRWTMDTATVQLATMLSAPASATDTEINVVDASLFTAGDTVLFVEGAATEAATIDAGGVDTVANTITLTAGLTGNFTIAAHVANTTEAPVENTDYILDRINGGISRVSTSTVIPDGATVEVSYTYAELTSESLYFGGKGTQDYFSVLFVSDARSDGKRWNIQFYNALFSGEFSLAFSPSEPTLTNIEIAAAPDSGQPEGKQLGRIYLA